MSINIRVENLKCYDEDINMYIPKEDEYCIIDGIDFIDIYFFNSETMLNRILEFDFYINSYIMKTL